MNTFGKLFAVTTFGESHGVGLGCVIDGCPPGIKITKADIQRELDRRKPGQSEMTTARKEADEVEILSGIFEDTTLGTPIALLVRNTDQRSKDYSAIKDIFRPGHADFTWQMKYGVRDYRGGGRSSGRETVARVMAGAVAKKILAHAGVSIVCYAQQVGPIVGEVVDVASIEKNTVRAADPQKAVEMEAFVLKAKEAGDSVGGVVAIEVRGCPIGLGEPVFDKINADLAKALVSIPTVKGIEFGAGFGVATKFGSENNDLFIAKKNTEIQNAGNFAEAKIVMSKNDAGGISGGITNGEVIMMRVAVKPPSSISKEQKTVDKDGNPVDLSVQGRHDPCIIPRFIPVAESMVALVLADHLLRARVYAK